MITITIETGNDAFSDDRGGEVARILRRLASHYDQCSQSACSVTKLRDVNGNTVGTVEDELDDDYAEEN